MIAPDHFGLQAFLLPSRQELDEALRFAGDLRHKAVRSQASQGELDPGRILPDHDLEPVTQVLQEDRGGQGWMPRQPKLNQQQQDQAGEGGGEVDPGSQKAGFLNAGLQGGKKS